MPADDGWIVIRIRTSLGYACAWLILVLAGIGAATVVQWFLAGGLR